MKQNIVYNVKHKKSGYLFWRVDVGDDYFYELDNGQLIQRNPKSSYTIINKVGTYENGKTIIQ